MRSSSKEQDLQFPRGVNHAAIIYGVAGGIAFILGISYGDNSVMPSLMLPFTATSVLAILGLYSRHQLGRLFALWVPIIGFFGGGTVLIGHQAGQVISDFILGLFTNFGSLLYYVMLYLFYEILTSSGYRTLNKNRG